MDIKLFFQAILKFIFGVVLVGALLFIPANSINYWNGWLNYFNGEKSRIIKEKVKDKREGK